MSNLNDISTNKSINKQIKELFDNDINLKERNDFAYDGIINEEKETMDRGGNPCSDFRCGSCDFQFPHKPWK